jgi:hypothetical protein
MKTHKFNDIYGLEDENTFIQYDQFELGKSLALKDRSIFDLSLPFSSYSIGPFDENSTTQSYYGQYAWENCSYNNDDSWPSAVGLPGDAEIIKENHLAYLGTSGSEFANAVANKPTFSYITNILGEENTVPYFDGGTTLYIESGTKSALNLSSNPNLIKFYRSGYLELTFKTNKQNCIIAYGSGTYISTSSTSNNANSVETVEFNDQITAINSSNAFINDSISENKEVILELKNGKLLFSYIDAYSQNSQSFEISGSKNIADDEWHHVILNIGRPGTIRNFGKKYSRKYIEFWVDGQLDTRTFDYINDQQIFFPTFTWIGSNAKKLFSNNPKDAWKTEDAYDSNLFAGYMSPYNTYNKIARKIFNANEKVNNFVGGINHIVVGINFALSKQEVQQRNRLFRGYEKNEADLFTASCELVMPSILTNKKKALKLFWNNLNKSADGLELDSNFDVESYSVTHKALNSATEINNVDMSNSKIINALADVRVAITDNLITWAPGTIINQNYPQKYGMISTGKQWNGEHLNVYDALQIDPNDSTAESYDSDFLTAFIKNLTYSGVSLKSGDRVLLTNQYSPKYNGIWVFGSESTPLTRAADSDSFEKIKDGVVYVTDGYYKDTTWKLLNNINSLFDAQIWKQMEYYPDEETFFAQPIYESRWMKAGEESFIDLEEHIDINKYDLIVFMNYPENNAEIKANFSEYDDFEIQVKYEKFIKSLQNVVANGANLFVASPKLAEDLGIVRQIIQIEQEIEEGDGRSAEINPFQFDEPAERYFDTHRQNAYHLDTPVPGLTDKETWVLTEAINYIPKDQYESEQWHLKYSYRQFGLQEGNEFLISSLPLRQVAIKDDLPGFRANGRRNKKLNVVAPNNVLAGTIVTSLANNHYHGADIAVNEYDDYATTIIVHDGQQLNGIPINGKIFVNCIEDGYTMSREEYNKAIIQVIPNNDPFETNSTKQWQYSTSRLNRSPKRINVTDLTQYGQTTPTNGGGGALIQAATNSSNGIIRSETDRNNKDYQSDLYPKENEEIYPIQEIPVLSMTWLGLQWLAGN